MQVCNIDYTYKICIYKTNEEMGRNDAYNQIYLHRSYNTSTYNTTVMPFLFRLSTKEAAKICQPKKNDPSSPKVSCMGQIKRNNNNKINSTTTTTPGKLKYAHLKKMFSGRNLLVTTTTNTTTYCKGNKCIKKIDTSVGTRPKFRNHGHGSGAAVVPLDLAELDPPLPVVKPPCGRRGEASLWKRRGGVAPLESLQIKNIHLPSNNTALFTPPM